MNQRTTNPQQIEVKEFALNRAVTLKQVPSPDNN